MWEEGLRGEEGASAGSAAGEGKKERLLRWACVCENGGRRSDFSGKLVGDRRTPFFSIQASHTTYVALDSFGLPARVLLLPISD